MAKYSDAQKEATARYNKKAYDRIDLIVKKGQREIIKRFAASQEKSLNCFILGAIEKDMNINKETEWIYREWPEALGFYYRKRIATPVCGLVRNDMLNIDEA